MTQRLLSIADDNWQDFDGYAVGHGFDLEDLPLSRFCNFVWWMCVRNAEQKDVEKFRVKLWRPPQGWEVKEEESPWSAENENAALASLKKSLGGGSGSNSAKTSA